MKHYRIECIGRNKWHVRHKASGKLVTSVGPLAIVTREQALRWARMAERYAPTDDENSAGAALVKRGYPRWYHRWIMRHYRRDFGKA